MLGSFHTALFVLALVCSVSTANAADFQKGLTAYHAGDFATAVEEWLPLAEQGDANAQTNLGALYHNGEGVLKDHAEAVRWYRLAAEQGDAYGQSLLGMMYSTGDGVLKDAAEAVRWYRLAAKQGHVSAQGRLGDSYRYGNGVLKNAVLAHMWYNIAGANGSTRGTRILSAIAARDRDEIEDDMTQEQIAQATQLARSCTASNYQDCE